MVTVFSIGHSACKSPQFQIAFSFMLWKQLRKKSKVFSISVYLLLYMELSHEHSTVLFIYVLYLCN